jgi:hypothetical protein
MMNWHLFSAFLFITIMLFLTPGSIVTLIVATGARLGMGAGRSSQPSCRNSSIPRCHWSGNCW